MALSNLMALTPPEVFEPGMMELLPWIKTALQVRSMGGKDMMELLRVLPMTAKEYLDEWFESEFLKGTLAASSITGSMQGPQSAGTAFMLLYQQAGIENGGYRSARFVRGGMGELAKAVLSAAQEYGVELQTGSKVRRVIIESGRATGVELDNGTQFKSNLVVSNADPKTTLLDFVGAENLEVRVARRARNIKFRGSTAKINLALSDLPILTATPPSIEHLSGHIVISPSLEYIEKAYDDAKYGRISTNPVLEIRIPTLLDDTLAPEGRHVMSINVRYAPYKLQASNWESQRKALGDHVINSLKSHIPDLKDLVLHRQTITPLDYENEYHATEGSIFHGQMGLDQLLIMRPFAGYAQYRMPVKNLYLCGAGSHPGGGVTGAPGYNAARQILRDT
jgi:phytoene dehydrogenase-like protein